MRIFILKPSSLGDVIQALPVLRFLKLHQPENEIFWWIDAGLASLLEGDPDLTGIIRFERRRWMSPRHWGELWQSLQSIRAQRFDWVIDLQSLLRSGVVAWLAHGALTIGLDDPREGARGFYDIAVPRPSYQTHAVDWYLHLLSYLNIPQNRPFTWLPQRPQVAAEIQARWHPEGTRWVALQPGARWENKRWPVAHFQETIRLLAQANAELRFAIIGGDADRDLGRLLAQAAPERCLDLTGSTSLPQMIEWLRYCQLLITNDSGPMHAAAALGKPIVALFGPTDPRRTGPYQQTDHILQHSLPCVPCMKDSCHWTPAFECLRGLSPVTVVARALEHLGSYPP